MFENLFRVGGAMWAVIPLVMVMVMLGVFAIGLDSRTLRALGRRS
jgi:hypothetical protein